MCQALQNCLKQLPLKQSFGKVFNCSHLFLIKASCSSRNNRISNLGQGFENTFLECIIERKWHGVSNISGSSHVAHNRSGHADFVRKNQPENVRKPYCWIYAWTYLWAGICPNFFDGICPNFAGKCLKFLFFQKAAKLCLEEAIRSEKIQG